MENNPILGGGYWTCSKCGQLMRGTSITHDCRTIKERAEEFFGKVLKSKNNFEKWIPVEGEIKEGDYVTINGEVHLCSSGEYLQAILAKSKEVDIKKVKLFLCSRDIQIGDRVNVERDGYDYGTVIKFGKDNDCEIVWIKTNDGKEEDWVKSSVYKVIK